MPLPPAARPASPRAPSVVPGRRRFKPDPRPHNPRPPGGFRPVGPRHYDGAVARPLAVLLVALLAGPSWGAPGRAAAALGPPAWRQGDTWTLKVRARELVLGKEAREAARLRAATEAPGTLASRLAREDRLTTYWTFKVAAVQAVPDGSMVLVQAKDKDGAKDALSSLLFRSESAREGVETFFGLSEGKFLGAVAGQPRVLRKVFWTPPDSARPVLPEASVIPHAFPVLPAYAGRTEVFPETRVRADMAFAFDSEQTVTPGVAAGDVGGPALVKQLEKAGYPTRDLVLVELYRPFDQVRARQLWAPGLPWAVWGEGPSASYHLVYHFQREAP